MVNAISVIVHHACHCMHQSVGNKLGQPFPQMQILVHIYLINVRSCVHLTLLSNMNSDCKKSLVANRAGVVNPEGEGEGGRDTEQGPLEECKNTAEVAGKQCRQGALQWLIRNIPQRLQAVIAADGRQITKEFARNSVSVTIMWSVFNKLCCFCNKFISP